MADLTIERQIVIEAPAEIVWRTITQPDQIVLWFADGAELDPTPGRSGTFHFDEHDHTEHFVVEVAEPPTHLALRWGPDQAVRVDFTLVAETPDRTRLTVAETGLEGVSWTDEERASYVTEHIEGWEFHLPRLVRLLSS